MDTIVSRFRRWFEHECDAIAQTFASLQTVPQDRRGDEPFRRATSVLGHIVASRGIWLARLGAVPPTTGAMFPADPDLAQLEADWNQSARQWADYFATVDDAILTQPFEYQSSDGGRFRNSIEDALTQLFTHSAYHRGQIAMLVRTAGGEPAATDFIYWCREAL